MTIITAMTHCLFIASPPPSNVELQTRPLASAVCQSKRAAKRRHFTAALGRVRKMAKNLPCQRDIVVIESGERYLDTIDVLICPSSFALAGDRNASLPLMRARPAHRPTTSDV